MRGPQFLRFPKCHPTSSDIKTRSSVQEGTYSCRGSYCTSQTPEKTPHLTGIQLFNFLNLLPLPWVNLSLLTSGSFSRLTTITNRHSGFLKVKGGL